jgi:hypothetical protein
MHVNTCSYLFFVYENKQLQNKQQKLQKTNLFIYLFFRCLLVLKFQVNLILKNKYQSFLRKVISKLNLLPVSFNQFHIFQDFKGPPVEPERQKQ